METRHDVHLFTCQKKGVLLVFFVGFGFCMLGSSSSSLISIDSALAAAFGIIFKVGKCDPNAESNNLNISSFCSSNKYIAKSYFEKYESFVESNFQDFTADELLASSCKLLPDNLNGPLRLLFLNRVLIGEGSHQHLHSSIRLHFGSESTSQLPTHFCKLIIIEKLPSGVFADPFELQHLLQRGVFTDIAAFGDTNLELPSVTSNQSVVEIHMNVSSNIFFGQTSEQEIIVDLPLHARYPPLGESGYSTVEFGEPDIFMHCSIQGNLNNQICLFAELKTSTVVWKIPSGTRMHTAIVSVITFVTAFISTSVIVATSMLYSDANFAKTSKLS